MPPTTYPPHNNPPWNPNQSVNQNPQQTQRRPHLPDRRPRQFDPIPMTYTELLPHLLQNSLVVPSPLKPAEPPYPRGCDQSAKCDYHAGAVGHTTENCHALKYKVQRLIDAKWLNFKMNEPNIGTNPLPSHGWPSINDVDNAGKEASWARARMPIRDRTEELRDCRSPHDFYFQFEVIFVIPSCRLI